IVGAILGFGAVIGGVDAVHWGETGSIALSWVISPLLSAIISYCMFGMLQRNILYAMNPIEATKKYIPLLIFIVFGTFTFSLTVNGLKNLHLAITFSEALGIAVVVGGIASALSYLIVRRLRPPDIGTRPPPRFLPQTVVSLEKAVKHL